MKYVQIQLLGSLQHKVWRDVFNKTHFLLDPSPHHHHHQVIVLIIISLHVRRLVGPGKAVVPLNLELVSLAGLPTHCHHHHLLQSSSSYPTIAVIIIINIVAIIIILIIFDNIMIIVVDIHSSFVSVTIAVMFIR